MATKKHTAATGAACLNFDLDRFASLNQNKTKKKRKEISLVISSLSHPTMYQK